MPVDPKVLEDATGILWSNKFTDVPDDGNCGMHAFWLGLKTLLKVRGPPAPVHMRHTTRCLAATSYIDAEAMLFVTCRSVLPASAHG